MKTSIGYNQINEQARSLDPENRKNLLTKAAEYSIEYLDSISNRRVFPIKESIDALQNLNDSLPEYPSNSEEVIHLLNKFGSEAAVTSTGGRYFGFVIGGCHPAGLAANWLAGAWDQNAGLQVTSPVNAEIEKIVSKWLTQILPVSKDAEAGFVTGVTMANFCGLAAARHSILNKLGWDVQSDGLFGAPEIKVVVGEEAHASLLKALELLGLGSKRLFKVPVDKQGRMLSNALPEMNEKTILCLQAGNVNSGSFDPAKEIIPAAKSKGAWIHVDGAFGLWAGLVPEKSYLTEGIELADSWATDGHKWLNVPYDSGIVLCKNSDILRAAMTVSGAYLDQSGSRIPYQFTPEMSRKARAIEIWAVLKTLGKNGVADLISRTCKHAARFADELDNAGFEILNDVVINQVLVSFGEPEVTNKIIAEIQKDGTCWCGGTIWQGKTAMRISVSSWATTDEDVELSLNVIKKIAKKYFR